MTAVITQPVSFNWNLTYERICEKALEKINEFGIGQTAPNSRDFNLCLEALDGILKTLQFQGLHWPSMSRGESDFILYKDVGQHLLPADYYGHAEIRIQNKTPDANGNFTAGEVAGAPLTLLGAKDWHDYKAQGHAWIWPGGDSWTSCNMMGWIDNSTVLWIWPVPTQNVACKLIYQRVIDDTQFGTGPRLRAPWAMALPYGVAVEVSHEFEIAQAKREDLRSSWIYYRDLCLANEIEQTHIDVTVR